ncbi:MAG: CPBP family intramembrane metalloprotease [Planctomycetaceae bacterium]|jgi:hypothetical protein|nr:CPBP family intramembrane metalloprotease [Planctomycetaceae bacterium]MBT6156204.1 CPBP family intramembrane metalloprotease [Planctomycetaceae bacterium]MBT6487137.1 CPBP family intramembrane metalloprotease [Planctomycetaceae bacterium]MBT6494748.1 CPBP family intramembrane metalloprotease [Planctomycetaceae bacterium]
MSKKIRDVVIYFAIAFGLTFLATQLPDLAFGAFKLKLLLYGFGPLVSGLICYWLLKTPNAIGVSLLGTRPVFSVAVCIVPLTTFCLTQTKHDLTVILVYALTQFVYCFGEEFGWRHYLQNATSFMNEWLQSFLVGLLWFSWHFSFLDLEDMSSKMRGGRDLPLWKFAPIMIVLLSLVSYLFGMMVKRSRSVLFPTVGHLLFKTNLVTMIVTGCVMCAILVFWNRLPFGEREDVA